MGFNFLYNVRVSLALFLAAERKHLTCKQPKDLGLIFCKELEHLKDLYLLALALT